MPCDFYLLSIYLSLFFFSSPNLSRRRLDVYHTLTHGVALVLFGLNSSAVLFSTFQPLRRRNDGTTDALVAATRLPNPVCRLRPRDRVHSVRHMHVRTSPTADQRAVASIGARIIIRYGLQADYLRVVGRHEIVRVRQNDGSSSQRFADAYRVTCDDDREDLRGPCRTFVSLNILTQ